MVTNIDVMLSGQTCLQQPIDFGGATTFDYVAYAVNIYPKPSFAPGCNPSSIMWVTPASTSLAKNSHFTSGAALSPAPWLPISLPFLAYLRRVSPLYMQDTCLQNRNNSHSGCDSDVVNGTTVTGSFNNFGTLSTLSDTSALCNQAIALQDYNATLKRVGNSTLDSGSVFESPTSSGFLFIQNRCPASAIPSNFTIKVSKLSHFLMPAP